MKIEVMSIWSLNNKDNVVCQTTIEEDDGERKILNLVQKIDIDFNKITELSRKLVINNYVHQLTIYVASMII